MKESFEAGRANSRKEEMNGGKAYEVLKAAKEAEIESGSEQVQTKQGQLAGSSPRRRRRAPPTSRGWRTPRTPSWRTGTSWRC